MSPSPGDPVSVMSVGRATRSEHLQGEEREVLKMNENPSQNTKRSVQAPSFSEGQWGTSGRDGRF